MGFAVFCSEITQDSFFSQNSKFGQIFHIACVTKSTVVQNQPKTEGDRYCSRPENYVKVRGKLRTLQNNDLFSIL